MKIIIGTKTYSSWSLRGWLAVAHTGLDFEEVKLALTTPEFKTSIPDLSPTKLVPVLHHEGRQIWDSLAIIDYCARLTPKKNWWPEDLGAYGAARSIAAEMHSGFMGLRTHAPMNFRGRWSNLTLSDAVAADVKRIDQIWQQCRNGYGAGGDFLFGGFGAADMMYAPIVSRFTTYDIDVSPISRAYMDAILNHPLMVRWQEDAATEDQVVPIDEVDPNATHLG
jgi:glutathione S-transferase